MNDKYVHPVVKGFLLVVALALFLYTYYSRQSIYDGTYLGHPNFISEQAVPIFDSVSMTACDKSWIYLIHGNSGILEIYTVDGKYVGYYVFYSGSNGQFSAYSKGNRLYVFDKHHNLYVLEELKLTEFVLRDDAKALRREFENLPDYGECRVDDHGVWLQSESGYELIIPTPRTHAAHMMQYVFLFGGVPIIIIFAFKYRKWEIGRQK